MEFQVMLRLHPMSIPSRRWNSKLAIWICCLIFLHTISARGLMVMIERCQRLDPSSILGGRTFVPLTAFHGLVENGTGVSPVVSIFPR
jgi:hypothetical protein